MASKPITIRLIRTGSQSDWNILYSIELQTIFYKYQYKNHKIRGRNLNVLHFYHCGNLSIIRCDKYILQSYLISMLNQWVIYCNRFLKSFTLPIYTLIGDEGRRGCNWMPLLLIISASAKTRVLKFLFCPPVIQHTFL